jgi:DNA-binding transcriptional regulator GbsR (MarR family)
VEAEVIEHFAEISRALGQPRSFAEIYGLLFISPAPLTMDDLIARLQISKGSASQGLKFLRDIGAVRAVENVDDRRTHYEAVAELRRLAGRFLRDQLAPRVAGNEKRLERLTETLDTLPPIERRHVADRLTMLRSWHKNTRRILPLVIKLLGS